VGRAVTRVIPAGNWIAVRVGVVDAVLLAVIEITKVLAGKIYRGCGDTVSARSGGWIPPPFPAPLPPQEVKAIATAINSTN